jgi:hypothetical protein
MKTLYRAICYKVSQKTRSFRTDYSHVPNLPSANPVNRIPVIFAGPFDTQKIRVRLDTRLVEQKRSLATADLDMDRPLASENIQKVDSAV